MIRREHHRFNSSRVDDGWYDEERRELEVQFPDGTMFTYKKVPRYVWEDFVSAASPGKFLNEVLTKRFMP